MTTQTRPYTIYTTAHDEVRNASQALTALDEITPGARQQLHDYLTAQIANLEPMAPIAAPPGHSVAGLLRLRPGHDYSPGADIPSAHWRRTTRRRTPI